MTPLSRAGALLGLVPRRSRALARLSLCSVAMAPALTGCLDAPPEYKVPDQVPPVIMTDRLVPATTSLQRPKTDAVDFTVPFRSDDAGEDLRAYFIRDIPAGNPKFNEHVVDRFVPIPADPRPFAEQLTAPQRSFTFPWQLTDVDIGCHTLTVILSHVSNFDTGNGELVVDDPTKAAQATWFFEISDSKL